MKSITQRGKTEVFREPTHRFNEETDSCRDMAKYSDLLEQAIQNMIGKKQEIGVASLFSKGGTTMQKEFYDGIERLRAHIISGAEGEKRCMNN